MPATLLGSVLISTDYCLSQIWRQSWSSWGTVVPGAGSWARHRAVVLTSVRMSRVRPTGQDTKLDEVGGGVEGGGSDSSRKKDRRVRAATQRSECRVSHHTRAAFITAAALLPQWHWQQTQTKRQQHKFLLTTATVEACAMIFTALNSPSDTINRCQKYYIMYILCRRTIF